MEGAHRDLSLPWPKRRPIHPHPILLSCLGIDIIHPMGYLSTSAGPRGLTSHPSPSFNSATSASLLLLSNHQPTILFYNFVAFFFFFFILLHITSTIEFLGTI